MQAVPRGKFSRIRLIAAATCAVAAGGAACLPPQCARAAAESDGAAAESSGAIAPATPAFVAPQADAERKLLKARPAQGAGWGGAALAPMESYPPTSLTAPTPARELGTLHAMDAPQVQPVEMASLSTVTIPRPDEVDLSGAVKLPPGARQGLFQKATFSGTWLPASSDEPDALGIGELDASVVFGVPLPRPDTPLLITPRFETSFLENAAPLDLPATLYGASTEFRHLRMFANSPWGMDAAVTVGYYSDFEIGTSDAIRVSGRGLAIYEPRAGTKWIVGVAYLNRAGATVIPVAGVIHEPASDVRWELIFPRPRVAWRLQGSVRNDERWVYLGGEFGGGIWSIARRSTGELDELSYRDLRLLVGYERKLIGGLSRRFEFGYVFDRGVEFASAAPDVSLDDALFARVAVSF